MFEITNVPPESRRGWKVFVNGEEVLSPGRVELVSDRWGKVTYGQRPEGYDSWVFEMRNNGVTLPYCIKGWLNKTLLVGLIFERRENMGGQELCIIGGFTEPGETLETALRREQSEEAGIDGKPFPIGGQMVTDRLFWDASKPGYGGNIPFAQKIRYRDLEEIGPDQWRPVPGLIKTKAESALIFVPWSDAVRRTRDAIALAALARLRNMFDQGDL